MLGLATAPMAATKGEFNNMCTQGLALGKDVPTDCSVNTTIKGKTYCFGNEQAKTDFVKESGGQSRKGAGLLRKQAPRVSPGLRETRSLLEAAPRDALSPTTQRA